VTGIAVRQEICICWIAGLLFVLVAVHASAAEPAPKAKAIDGIMAYLKTGKPPAGFEIDPTYSRGDYFRKLSRLCAESTDARRDAAIFLAIELLGEKLKRSEITGVLEGLVLVMYQEAGHGKLLKRYESGPLKKSINKNIIAYTQSNQAILGLSASSKVYDSEPVGMSPGFEEPALLKIVGLKTWLDSLEKDGVDKGYRANVLLMLLRQYRVLSAFLNGECNVDTLDTTGLNMSVYPQVARLLGVVQKTCKDSQVFRKAVAWHLASFHDDMVTFAYSYMGASKLEEVIQMGRAFSREAQDKALKQKLNQFVVGCSAVRAKFDKEAGLYLIKKVRGYKGHIGDPKELALINLCHKELSEAKFGLLSIYQKHHYEASKNDWNWSPSSRIYAEAMRAKQSP